MDDDSERSDGSDLVEARSYAEKKVGRSHSWSGRMEHPEQMMRAVYVFFSGQGRRQFFA